MWPAVVAVLHLGVLLGSAWLYPSHNEPGISLALPFWFILLWPWFLGMWAFGKIGAVIGIILGFLWLPGIAYWITRITLKKPENLAPNTPFDATR